VSLLSMALICIIAARLGIEVIGRISAYFLPFLFFIIVFVQFLGISQIQLHFLKPILGNGLGNILKGGFSTFSFPFAESVLFMGVFSSLKTKKSPLKVYLWGILIS